MERLETLIHSDRQGGNEKPDSMCACVGGFPMSLVASNFLLD